MYPNPARTVAPINGIAISSESLFNNMTRAKTNNPTVARSKSILDVLAMCVPSVGF
jgi:hypothetical protein